MPNLQYNVTTEVFSGHYKHCSDFVEVRFYHYMWILCHFVLSLSKKSEGFLIVVTTKVTIAL